MVMEKREAQSVRYGRRKERTIISECHIKNRASVSIYIKRVIKMGMSLMTDMTYPILINFMKIIIT